MSRLAVRPELIKLARVLGTEPRQLQFLDKLAPETLRGLREQVTASLYDRQMLVLKRIASASRLLPIPLLAIIAEKVFGPLLCARVAGLIAPERAIDIAARLPTAFLADVTIELDPRRAADLVASFPVDRVVEIAQVLLERCEYITLGRFVDVLRRSAVEAVIKKVKNDEALLHTAFMIESRVKLNEVVGLLADKRLREIIQAAAASDDDLWPEALSLMAGVDPRLQQRLGDMVAEMDEAIIGSLIRSAQDNELWAAFLPFVSLISDKGLQRLGRHEALQEPDFLEAVARAADDFDLWPQVLPLVRHMDATGHRQVAKVYARLGTVTLERVVTVVVATPELMPSLTNVTQHLSPRQQREVEKILARLAR
jgi:hypothetical protein